MAAFKLNRDILRALETVIDLPTHIKTLTLTLDVENVPELRMTTIIIKPKGEPGPLVSRYAGEKTARYRLVEIVEAKIVDGHADVTGLMDTSRKFAPMETKQDADPTGL